MPESEGCDHCKNCNTLTWKVDMKRGLCIECLFKYTRELEDLAREFLDTMRANRLDPAANGLSTLIELEGRTAKRLGKSQR